MGMGCDLKPRRDLSGMETEWIRVVEPTRVEGKSGWHYICECKTSGCRFVAFGKLLQKGKYKRCPRCKHMQKRVHKKKPLPLPLSHRPVLTCQICGKSKPRASFRFNYLCRKCWAWRRRSGKHLLRLISNLGCMNPHCQWFGATHHSMIDFHHKDPATKLFTLGKSNQFSFEKVVAEIEKCVCLCANCHRLHHRGMLDLSHVPTVKVELCHLEQLIEQKCNAPDGSYQGKLHSTTAPEVVQIPGAVELSHLAQSPTDFVIAPEST